MKTAHEYIRELHDNGTVTMAIHPEHVGHIKSLYDESFKLAQAKSEKKKALNLASRKADIAREELWNAITDSFDGIMQAVEKESVNRELDSDNFTITFRNKKQAALHYGRMKMQEAGLPKEIQEKILGAVKKSMDDDGEIPGINIINMDDDD